MAGFQGGRAVGCSGCLGLGLAVSVPHVSGHPSSICIMALKVKMKKSHHWGLIIQISKVLGRSHGQS